MKFADMPLNWPGGSGAWDQPRIVILSNDRRALSDPRSRERISVVATPLDLIMRLEAAVRPISIVVLDGVYAGNLELAATLLDMYPELHVVDGDPDTSPTMAGPTSCGISLIA